MTDSYTASVPAQPSPNPTPDTGTPQPFNLQSYKINDARAAGYGDDEIINYLASQNSNYKFGEALKEGYSPTEVLNYLWPDSAQPSGYMDQAKEGAAGVFSGIGKTVDVNSTPGGTVNNIGKALESAGAYIAPQNFKSADLTGPNGKFSNLGLWLARQVPAAGTALGGALAAGYLAPESALAATAGAMLPGVAMTAGNEEQTAADNRTGQTGAPVTTPDMLRGVGTSVAENAVNALPVGRYLGRLAGPLEQTGMPGVMSAAKGLVKTAAYQGAAGAGSDVVHQLGQSVGTPGGVNIDPQETATAGVGGAAMGGLLGGPKAVRGALDAAKYREITPDLQPAATQVANRVQQNAGGESLSGRLLFTGGAQRAGEAAVNKTGMDIGNELNDAVADLRSRVNLPTDADNILKAAQNGQMPTEQGYGVLSDAVSGDQQGPNVLNLIQQKHVFGIVNDTGQHINGKFRGGLGGLGGHVLTGEHAGKSAIAALGGAAFEGGAGHLIAYSPQVLAAVAGVRALGRLTDNITGAQAPAGRFVRNFGSPDAGVRLNVPAAAQAPVAGEQSPFPTRPVAGGVGSTPMIPPALRAQMGARAALAKLQPQAETEPAVNPLALPKTVTGPATTLMRGAMAAQRMRDRAATAQPAAAPETPVNPMTLPTAITGPAKSIMKGAALAQRVKATQDAATQSAQEAQAAKIAGLASVPQAPAVNPMALPASITGPARNIVKGMVMTQKLNARSTANGASTVAPAAPVSVSKASDGTVSANAGNGKRPVAPYSTLATPEAARRILNDRLAAGIPIENPPAYLAKIHGVLTALREKLSAVATEAPGIPPTELARFEGVRSQKSAAEWRDKLAAEYPAAAPVLKKVFSDDAIATQWNAKR